MNIYICIRFCRLCIINEWKKTVGYFRTLYQLQEHLKRDILRGRVINFTEHTQITLRMAEEIHELQPVLTIPPFKNPKGHYPNTNQCVIQGTNYSTQDFELQLGQTWTVLTPANIAPTSITAGGVSHRKTHTTGPGMKGRGGGLTRRNMQTDYSRSRFWGSDREVLSSGT
jgi:hypothetical protein